MDLAQEARPIMRQIAIDPNADLPSTDFGFQQQRLAENLNSLGVPAYFNAQESYAVRIQSKDIAKSKCSVPICRLLRRLSRHLNMDIDVVFFEEGNHFEKIHPNQINIDPDELRSFQEIIEFVNLKSARLTPTTSHPTEVLKHELTHLIFFKFSRGNDHFFSGRYRLRNIPGYRFGISFEEALTYALANFDREKMAKRHFANRMDALYFPEVINEFLNEIMDFLPPLEKFVKNQPQVFEITDTSEFRADFGIVDLDLIIQKYRPTAGFAAVSLPASEMPYRGHNSGAKFFHVFIAADGRTLELYLNHKIQDINNWDEFFRQQARVLLTLDDLLNSSENPKLREIRNAFANPNNRFQVEVFTCDGLF